MVANGGKRLDHGALHICESTLAVFRNSGRRSGTAGESAAWKASQASTKREAVSSWKRSKAPPFCVTLPAAVPHGTARRSFQRQINMETSGEELRQGLMQARDEGGLKDALLDALMDLLSAGFDRAALAIAEDRPADDYKAAIRLILSGLFEKAWRAGASEPRADLRSSAEGRF